MGDLALELVEMWVRGVPGLCLHLIEPTQAALPISREKTRRFMEDPPYWCLCWPSGLWLARALSRGQVDCVDKTVLDLGCGCGIVGLAASLAGAERVVCCDTDLRALERVRQNAELCKAEVETVAVLPEESFDLILLADVLYDPDNLELLEQIRPLGREIWVADSKMHDPCEGFEQVLVVHGAQGLPDLDPNGEFSKISLYRSAE